MALKGDIAVSHLNDEKGRGGVSSKEITRSPLSSRKVCPWMNAVPAIIDGPLSEWSDGIELSSRKDRNRSSLENHEGKSRLGSSGTRHQMEREQCSTTRDKTSSVSHGRSGEQASSLRANSPVMRDPSSGLGAKGGL